MKKTNEYYTHLDSLRGIAALFVALLHVNWDNHITRNAFVESGALFVDFFFVLSGIIMSHVYPNLTTLDDVGVFLKRRFARLYPLHLATLLAVAAAFLGVYLFVPKMWHTLAWLPEMQGLTWKFFASLFLLNAHGLTDADSFNVPSWSIGAEATCYLVFAAICLLAFRRRYHVYVVFVLASLAFLFWQDRNIIEFRSYFGFVRGMFGFFSGCLVYALWNRKKPDASLWVPIALTVGICVDMAYSRSLPVRLSLVIPFLFAGLLYLLIDPDPRLKSFLSLPPLHLLGTLSYSIYLVHFLVRWVFGGLIIAHFHTGYGAKKILLISPWLGDVFVLIYAGLVIAVAWVSYNYYEDPLRRRLRAWSSKRKFAPQSA